MRPPGRADLRGGGGARASPQGSRFEPSRNSRDGQERQHFLPEHDTGGEHAGFDHFLENGHCHPATGPSFDDMPRTRNHDAPALSFIPMGLRAAGCKLVPTGDHTLRAWAARKASSTIARSPSSTAATARASSRGSSPRRIRVRASKSPHMRSKAGTSSRNS